MRNTKPTIGFMAIGLLPYWDLFPGMKENCERHHEMLGANFDQISVDMVDVGIVDSEGLAREAGECFASRKVDIVFCQMLTYAASVYIAPAVRMLSVPVIILNVQHKKALDYQNVTGIKDWLGEGITCAGVPEATAVLNRIGKSYATITGHMEGDPCVPREIMAWCRAVHIKKKLARQNVGLFGRPYGGMMDLCIDETKLFEKFGTFVHHLDWQEIINTGLELGNGQIVNRMETMKEVFEMNGGMSDEDIRYIARTTEACLSLCQKYQLNSCAVHYEFDAPAEQIDLVAALNPAMTMMMTEGIAGAPEGDIKSALAMLILKSLAGNAMTAELYSMDFHDGTCLVGHSGACDAAISNQKAVLKMSQVLHGKKGKGYVTQFYPEYGPITMVALTETRDGRFKLVAAEGESVEGPVLMLGDTNLRVKFPKELREFVNEWSMEGPTHHGVLAMGLYIRELQCVARVLDIELKVITKLDESKNVW